MLTQAERKIIYWKHRNSGKDHEKSFNIVADAIKMSNQNKPKIEKIGNQDKLLIAIGKKKSIL